MGVGVGVGVGVGRWVGVCGAGEGGSDCHRLRRCASTILHGGASQRSSLQ